MTPVILTPGAVTSLDEVTSYLARKNQPTAYRFLTAVEVLLERLGANPSLGMHVRVEHPRLSAIAGRGFRDFGNIWRSIRGTVCALWSCLSFTVHGIGLHYCRLDGPVASSRDLLPL